MLSSKRFSGTGCFQNVSKKSVFVSHFTSIIKGPTMCKNGKGNIIFNNNNVDLSWKRYCKYINKQTMGRSSESQLQAISYNSRLKHLLVNILPGTRWCHDYKQSFIFKIMCAESCTIRPGKANKVNFDFTCTMCEFYGKHRSWDGCKKGMWEWMGWSGTQPSCVHKISVWYLNVLRAPVRSAVGRTNIM